MAPIAKYVEAPSRCEVVPAMLPRDRKTARIRTLQPTLTTTLAR
jgi:hypothetical protein